MTENKQEAQPERTFESYFNEAVQLSESGKDNEAAELLQELTELRPGVAEVWYNLAACFARGGQNERVKPALENAVALEYRLFRQIRKDKDFSAFLSSDEGREFIAKNKRPVLVTIYAWVGALMFSALFLPTIILFYGWSSVSGSKSGAAPTGGTGDILTAFIACIFVILITVLFVKILVIDLLRRRLYSLIINRLAWILIAVLMLALIGGGGASIAWLLLAVSGFSLYVLVRYGKWFYDAWKIWKNFKLR